MKQVDKKNINFIPTAVPVYYRETPASNTFIRLVERSKIPSTIDKLFVDLKQLAPRPVLITKNIDETEKVPRGPTPMSVPKDAENKEYTEEMLSEIEVPELQSVQNGGLVEYTSTKISNGAAVIYYLELVHDYAQIDNFDLGSFTFS